MKQPKIQDRNIQENKLPGEETTGNINNAMMNDYGFQQRCKVLVSDPLAEKNKSAKKQQSIISYNFDHLGNGSPITHNIFIGWDEDEPKNKAAKNIRQSNRIDNNCYNNNFNGIKSRTQKTIKQLNLSRNNQKATLSENQSTKDQTKRFKENISRPLLDHSKIVREEDKQYQIEAEIFNDQTTVKYSRLSRNQNKQLGLKLCGINKKINRNISYSTPFKGIENRLQKTRRNFEAEKIKINEQIKKVQYQEKHRWKLNSYSVNSNKDMRKKQESVFGQKNSKNQYRNGKTIQIKKNDNIKFYSEQNDQNILDDHADKNNNQGKGLGKLNYNINLQNSSKGKSIKIKKLPNTGDSLQWRKDKQDKDMKDQKNLNQQQFCDYGADTLKLIEQLEKMQSEQISNNHNKQAIKNTKDQIFEPSYYHCGYYFQNEKSSNLKQRIKGVNQKKQQEKEEVCKNKDKENEDIEKQKQIQKQEKYTPIESKFLSNQKQIEMQKISSISIKKEGKKVKKKTEEQSVDIKKIQKSIEQKKSQNLHMEKKKDPSLHIQKNIKASEKMNGLKKQDKGYEKRLLIKKEQLNTKSRQKKKQISKQTEKVQEREVKGKSLDQVQKNKKKLEKLIQRQHLVNDSKFNQKENFRKKLKQKKTTQFSKNNQTTKRNQDINLNEDRQEKKHDNQGEKQFKKSQSKIENLEISNLELIEDKQENFILDVQNKLNLQNKKVDDIQSRGDNNGQAIEIEKVKKREDNTDRVETVLQNNMLQKEVTRFKIEQKQGKQKKDQIEKNILRSKCPQEEQYQKCNKAGDQDQITLRIKTNQGQILEKISKKEDQKDRGGESNAIKDKKEQMEKKRFLNSIENKQQKNEDDNLYKQEKLAKVQIQELKQVKNNFQTKNKEMDKLKDKKKINSTGSKTTEIIKKDVKKIKTRDQIKKKEPKQTINQIKNNKDIAQTINQVKKKEERVKPEIDRDQKKLDDYKRQEKLQHSEQKKQQKNRQNNGNNQKQQNKVTQIDKSGLSYKKQSKNEVNQLKNQHQNQSKERQIDLEKSKLIKDNKQIQNKKQKFSDLKNSLQQEIVNNQQLNEKCLKKSPRLHQDDLEDSDSELQITPIVQTSNAPKQITCISKKSTELNLSNICLQQKRLNSNKSNRPIKIKQLKNASVQINDKENNNAKDEENKVVCQQDMISFANISCSPKIEQLQKESFLDIQSNVLNKTDFPKINKPNNRKMESKNNRFPDNAEVLNFVYGQQEKRVAGLLSEIKFSSKPFPFEILDNQVINNNNKHLSILNKSLQIIQSLEKGLEKKIIEPYYTQQGEVIVWLYYEGHWGYYRIQDKFSNLIQLYIKVLDSFLLKQTKEKGDISLHIEEVIGVFTGLRVIKLKNKKKMLRQLENQLKKGIRIKGISNIQQNKSYQIRGIEKTKMGQNLLQIRQVKSNKFNQQIIQNTNNDKKQLLWIKEQAFHKYFDYFLFICHREQTYWTSKEIKSPKITKTYVYTIDSLETVIGSIELHGNSGIFCSIDFYRQAKPRLLKFIGSLKQKKDKNTNMFFNFNIKGRYYMLVKIQNMSPDYPIHLSVESNKKTVISYLQSIQHDTYKNLQSQYVQVDKRRTQKSQTSSLHKQNSKVKRNKDQIHQGLQSVRNMFIDFLVASNKGKIKIIPEQQYLKTN